MIKGSMIKGLDKYRFKKGKKFDSLIFVGKREEILNYRVIERNLLPSSQKADVVFFRNDD